jgi:hypothetical protein
MQEKKKFDPRFYVACPKRYSSMVQGIVAITTCLKCEQHEFDDGNRHRCLLKDLEKK